ncbi:MAG: hypothetical protein FT726_19290 [Pantoea sp. Morm]|nr:hypothetical protein [Pantoea sp. Morm]
MKEQSMINKIVVEMPISWIKNPVDGYKHEHLISKLIITLAQRKIPLYFREVPFGADEAPRKPAKGELIFSYHSWSNEKNVFHIKEAPVTPLFTFDRRGYSGWADICVNPEFYERSIKSQDIAIANSVLEKWRGIFEKTNDSKYPQSDEPLPSDIHDFVFYPMQVQNDPVSIHSHFDGVQLLVDAANIAQRTKTHLVVKRHPFCNSTAVEETLKKLSTSNPWVIQSNSNIHHLIRKAKSVITINSGVGIEALIDGTTVYCSGKCEWQFSCQELIDLKDLENAFILDAIPMNENQVKYLAYLLEKYWINPSNSESLEAAIDDAFKGFDNEYGVEADKISSPDVLLPVILDLQGRLEYEIRKSKLAEFDSSSIIKLYKALKEEHSNTLSQFKYYIEKIRAYESQVEQLEKKIIALENRSD